MDVLRAGKVLTCTEIEALTATKQKKRPKKFEHFAILPFFRVLKIAGEGLCSGKA